MPHLDRWKIRAFMSMIQRLPALQRDANGAEIRSPEGYQTFQGNGTLFGRMSAEEYYAVDRYVVGYPSETSNDFATTKAFLLRVAGALRDYVGFSYIQPALDALDQHNTRRNILELINAIEIDLGDFWNKYTNDARWRRMFPPPP
jgi:hypothetical protein